MDEQWSMAPLVTGHPFSSNSGAMLHCSRECSIVHLFSSMNSEIDPVGSVRFKAKKALNRVRPNKIKFFIYF